MPFLFLLLLPLFLLLWWFFDRRYRGRRQDAEPRATGDLRPTGEVFRDPATGRLTEVLEDPRTGERVYREK